MENKKLFKPNDYIELSCYDYNGNYPIWSSYDYFIYKILEFITKCGCKTICLNEYT